MNLSKQLEKDLTTEINRLFNNLSKTGSFESIKKSLFSKNKQLHFYFNNNGQFDNKVNSTLEFENNEVLSNFLKQEKNLAVKFQEFEKAAEINELIESYAGQNDIDSLISAAFSNS